MRTIFEIVLGILFNVAKACMHALASAAGVMAGCAILALAGVYAWRRGLRRTGLIPNSCAADENNVISIED